MRRIRTTPPARPAPQEYPLRLRDADGQVSEVTAVWLVRLSSGGRCFAMELLVCWCRFEATLASALFPSSAFMTGTNSISALPSRQAEVAMIVKAEV